MELKHLRYFLAVARELHFGRAAQKLHMSQPPLSARIRDLESQLGARLFVRVPGQIRLTAAGKVLQEQAQSILAKVDHARQLVQEAALGRTGSLEIGYAPAMEIRILPAILKSFRRKHPDIKVNLHALGIVEQARSMTAGSAIDAALLWLPATGGEVDLYPLRREALVLAAPEKHPLASARAVTLKTLQSIPYVSFPRSYAPVLYDSVQHRTREAGISLNVSGEGSNLHDMLSLIAGGLGVSILPESVRSVPRPGVVFRSLSSPGLWIEAGLACHRGRVTQAQSWFCKVARVLYPAAG